MSVRTLEDQLRGEYFELLPHIRRVTEISARMQRHYADVIRALSSFEQEFDSIATVESQITQGNQATADFNTRCG